MKARPSNPFPEESGSVTAQTAAIVLLVAAIAFGAMGLLSQAGLSVGKARAETRRDEANRAAISEILKMIAATPDEGVDSPLNPVFSAISVPSGTEVKIEDESSKLNPNYLRKNIIDETRIRETLAEGKSSKELQQYREDEGLSGLLEPAYSTFFLKEGFTSRFGTRSYANINSCDEFALRKLYAEATGDSYGAEAFHSAVSRQLAALKIAGEREIAPMLGTGADKAGKFITAQGQINVNYADTFILDCILSLPSFKFPGHASLAQTITDERKNSAIDGKRLRQILGNITESHPIFGYLGTRTWFWKITAITGKSTTTAIAARILPFDPLSRERKIRVIEVHEHAKD